ncbi:MAG: helix-turn-helix transcriptional regulator [Parvularculaceae bacterium]
MAKKSPNPVDQHVGQRVRYQRNILGMSQDKLGEALGLTFQQVQKYEKGANRIGASRLWQIAKTLNVPVSFFFEGLNQNAAQGFAEEADGWAGEYIASAEGMQLCRYFSAIEEPQIRKRLLDLVKSLAETSSRK